MKKSASGNTPTLIATMTNEPFQPVRLYYRIPDRSSVTKTLRRLECMAEDRAGPCWEWLFHGEATRLRFSRGRYDDIPKERRPIVLGRIRFPRSDEMSLETNSIERAMQGVRFFAPLLGPRVAAMRCRIVNRFFGAHEGSLQELMKSLDRDVTVIDPRKAEAQFVECFKGVRSARDAERAGAKWLERKLRSGGDVPEVEDFPLAPEEETADFQHLALTLRFRFVRAAEHWQGNTRLTLAEIIARTFRQAIRTGSAPRG